MPPAPSGHTGGWRTCTCSTTAICGVTSKTEMRRAADFLGIRVSHDCWPALVNAAGFPPCGPGPDEVAPAYLGDWTSNHAFFKCARLDEWRDVLTAENQALYEELAPQRVPPALRAWLEGGRKAADLKQV